MRVQAAARAAAFWLFLGLAGHAAAQVVAPARDPSATAPPRVTSPDAAPPPGAPADPGAAATPRSANGLAATEVPPEADSGFEMRPLVVGQRTMAVTAHPAATAAADWALSVGGSAVDAAIAAQMVLGLVEPQSSGIGGGAFLLHFSADDGAVRAYDGRETAPRAADGTLFLDREGKALPFFAAVVGGRSVGVPGVVRMLEFAHTRHGRLPWQSLFEPAIALAEAGFEVSPRLHRLIASDRFLSRDPETAAYFLDGDGRPWPVGHRLRNPAYARTLRAIAARGSAAIHEGEIALDIVVKVRDGAGNPGRLDATDLASYFAVERQPICRPYRRYEVCGMPPPSSGGIAIAQMLGILERLPPEPLLAADGSLREQAVHRLTEAARLAFADREQYIGDPAFVRMPAPPYDPLLADGYLRERANMIGPRTLGVAPPGRISQPEPTVGAWARYEQSSTSHLSIVDAQGNAAALTTSIENQFGARLMVRGFLLNNQLTDFSYEPQATAGLAANRIEGRKRPRSSMSPTLVFHRTPSGRRGPLALVIGSPGGAAIINYVAQSLVAILDEGLPADSALALAHVGSRNGPTELEAERAPAALGEALRARGHRVRYARMTSGLHAIARDCRADRCRLLGAVDPRREGLAIGR